MENEKNDRGVDFYVADPLVYLKGVILGPCCSKQIVELQSDINRLDIETHRRNCHLQNIYKIERRGEDWTIHEGRYIADVSAFRAHLNETRFSLDSELINVNPEKFVNYRCKFEKLLQTPWQAVESVSVQVSDGLVLQAYKNTAAHALAGVGVYYFVVMLDSKRELTYGLYIEKRNGLMSKIFSASEEYLCKLKNRIIDFENEEKVNVIC